jgi:hypothetical protein
MKIIPEEFLKKGNQGVAFIKQMCEKNKIKFVLASKKEDLTLGIDCYIDEIPTDVKNTEDIYICQILLNTGTVNVRHPFKTNSKATHYAVCKVAADLNKGKLIEHVNIDERLLRDFIKDKENLKAFKQAIQTLQNKKIKELGLHLNHACINIKSQISKFLKEDIGLSYDEPTQAENEISFKFYKKRKTKQVGEKNLNIKSILSQYKKETLSEEIIIIKI